MSAHATVCKKSKVTKIKIFFLFSKIIRVTDATFKAFNLAKTRNVFLFLLSKYNLNVSVHESVHFILDHNVNFKLEKKFHNLWWIHWHQQHNTGDLLHRRHQDPGENSSAWGKAWLRWTSAYNCQQHWLENRHCTPQSECLPVNAFQENLIRTISQVGVCILSSSWVVFLSKIFFADWSIFPPQGRGMVESYGIKQTKSRREEINIIRHNWIIL